MQLVAYGAQDVYLTGNPQITFWKVTYRRHTNFAMESIEQTFNGQADFGRRVQCTVSRNGDLAYRTYLQVTLPEINQSDGNPKRVFMPAGLTTPDTSSSLWLRLRSEVSASTDSTVTGCTSGTSLRLPPSRSDGFHKMIGNTTQLTYLTDEHSPMSLPACSSADVPNAVCAPRNAFPRPLSTFL